MKGLPPMRVPAQRRGFATLLVFGVIVVAAVVISLLQSTAFSQAAAGREALARLRAQWAARAGVEAMVARLEFETENPDTSDAFKALEEMSSAAEGVLVGASFRVSTFERDAEVSGPADAHAKLNINRLTRDQLLLLEPLMTEDVADSILDWIDPDEDTRELGAEVGYYQSLPGGYEPRNAPMSSIVELELVAGVDPEDVRGEDWNLNGLLEANEDDGDESWPADNADGVLDAGWSAVLTASSVEGSLAASGEERLDLTLATEAEIMDRTTVTRDQATAIIGYLDGAANASLGDFIRRDLSQLAPSGGQGQPAARVENLTPEQVGLILDECSVGTAAVGALLPGKLNINTCAAETLEFLPEIDAAVADAIVADREGRAEGYTSIVQLQEVAGMGRRQLANIYELLCVRSSVYVVTSRGRDARTGLEVEMMATLDRSRLPVVLTEVLVR